MTSAFINEEDAEMADSNTQDTRDYNQKVAKEITSLLISNEVYRC
jgi:hypothetical protein